MSHPKEIIFPAINKAVIRRLLLRNSTKTDFAVKLRTNNEALIIDPSQGFLRAGSIQSVSLRLNDTHNISQRRLVEIYCRPVNKNIEAECRRWFHMPIAMGELSNQLAQILRIKTSAGFTPLETVLDLPCRAIVIQAEQHPMLLSNDSDTVTAHQIDSGSYLGTATACNISEAEILTMLPPDWLLKTAEAIEGNGWNRNILSWTHPSCGWLEKFFDSIFPPDEAQETIVPCATNR